MSDYTNLTQQELISLLEQKDSTIANLQEGKQTCESVISSIIHLSEEERELLPSKIRTTETGILAYGIFIHGATSCWEVNNDNQDPTPTPVGDTTNPSEPIYT
ncbi:hypothetical protein ABW636_14110 [Aquimarina sp. 2201CG1-2-11]|uniref:hypothetical protein n=1 Tax=Aquimarina discodermiae TaxID=3231043 RepID=UPI0034624AA0